MGTLNAIAAGLVLLTAFEASAGPSFTAEAVQTQQGQPPETGRIYFSDQGMRMEFQRQGRPVVQIIMPGQGLMRILFPQDKAYAEIKGPAAPDFATRPESPCPPPEAGRCERLGTETIDGVATETWRITPAAQPTQPAQTGAQAGAGGSFQVWWDRQRRLPLRERHADGSTAQTTLKGKVSFQGRAVEHWETTFVGTDGKSRRAARLHDPELDVDVREDYPSGATRELRNIKLVPVDPGWFAVPADYRKVDPGQAGTQPGPALGASGSTPAGRR
ncbi:MAG: DUF4412 domain-containing protein [Alphaproteobacteria bacterium]